MRERKLCGMRCGGGVFCGCAVGDRGAECTKRRARQPNTAAHCTTACLFRRYMSQLTRHPGVRVLCARSKKQTRRITSSSRFSACSSWNNIWRARCHSTPPAHSVRKIPKPKRERGELDEARTHSPLVRCQATRCAPHKHKKRQYTTLHDSSVRSSGLSASIQCADIVRRAPGVVSPTTHSPQSRQIVPESRHKHRGTLAWQL